MKQCSWTTLVYKGELVQCLLALIHGLNNMSPCRDVLLYGGMLYVYAFTTLQLVQFLQSFCRHICSRTILPWYWFWEKPCDAFVNSDRILFWRCQQQHSVCDCISQMSPWDFREVALYKIVNTVITFEKKRLVSSEASRYLESQNGWLFSIFKAHLVQYPCNKQGHLPRDQVAQSPVQPHL